MPRLILPPANLYAHNPHEAPYRAYAYRNYLRPGLMSRLRLRRFVTALRLAGPVSGAARALDVGCADGIFLPTLAHHFSEVCGLDVMPDQLRTAEYVLDRLGIRNARTLNVQGLSSGEVLNRLGSPFDIAFVLETFEHVGSRATMWEDKMRLLDEIFSWLGPEGRVVISVPRMVGLAFGMKHLLQAATGQAHEPIPTRDALRAVILRDTRRLEHRFSGGHVGFNHLVFERHLHSSQYQVRRKPTLTSVFYLLQR